MSTQIRILGAALSVVLLVLAGCGGERVSYDEPAEPAEAAEPTEVAEPTEAASLELTPELQAKLARADRADGEEDHMVADCPGCGLAMQGETDYVIDVGDYALHFCSDSCRDEFSEDLDGSLVALVVPEEEADTEAEPQP